MFNLCVLKSTYISQYFAEGSCVWLVVVESYPHVYSHSSKKKPVDHFLVQNEPKKLTGGDL